MHQEKVVTNPILQTRIELLLLCHEYESKYLNSNLSVKFVSPPWMMTHDETEKKKKNIMLACECYNIKIPYSNTLCSPYSIENTAKFILLRSNSIFN